MTTLQHAEFKVAAVQSAPHYLDPDASTDKACRLIDEAAATGAVLAAFSETWLPGYPFFLFSMPDQKWWKAAAAYLAAAIEIPGPQTGRLCAAARKAGIDVVIGVAERDAQTGGSVYCTLLFIGREGTILGRHRKIKPTHNERAIWAEGDATGLNVYQRAYGRISGLCCWEHNTVLPGYALMAQGTQIHIAAWPGRELKQAPPRPVSLASRQLLLSRAFASQAASYVLCVGGLRSAQHIPEEFRELNTFDTTGDSYIIDPRGEVLAGPAVGESILVAQCSREDLYAAKAACDVGGHYSRPDLFRVLVNRSPQPRIALVTDFSEPARESSFVPVEPGLPK
jgi:nitrilase